MSRIDMAIQALRDASDAQLKKLYLKGKKEEPKKEEEQELTDEEAEQLRQMLEE